MNIIKLLKRYSQKKIQLGRLNSTELLDAIVLHNLELTTLRKGRIITLTEKGINELKKLQEVK